VTAVTGLPGNVGMLDIELAPDFATSHVIYISFMVRDLSAPRIGRYESDPCRVPERMVVARARLVEGGSSASLSDLQEIFRQQPTITTYRDSG
jgi:hypothetical protein